MGVNPPAMVVGGFIPNLHFIARFSLLVTRCSLPVCPPAADYSTVAQGLRALRKISN